LPSADVEQPPDDELAAKALEEIHNAERLSGFGRFAMKLQKLLSRLPNRRNPSRDCHI